MTASTLSLGPVLTYSQALDAWRAGAHDAALACCERLIAADPCDADALHLAGVILLGRDRAAARALLSRAAAAHETAEILVSQALALDPDEARQAQALLERALELDPACSAALNNLANLYAARRDTARASAMFERLIEQQPDNVLAHYNYGSLLVGNGASAQAIAPLRRALALDPSHTYSYINLAAALLDENQHAEALALLEHARTVQPDSALLLATLGSQQRRNGQLELARATFMRAIELDPRNAHAWNGIGNLFYEVSNIDEAQRAFARAVELKPDFSDALGNLGNIFRASGDIAQSIATYRRALELRPDNAEAHSNLTYMLAFATDDAAIIRAEAEAFCAWHEAQWLAPAVMHDNTREPARRLRIGYVSPDFREHCQRLFMTPLLAHHDHAAFEIVCYSTVMTPDAVTQQLASYADIWRDVRDYDDDRLAQQIRADGIDILVDLTMHMNGARRLVFARRPAPVQVAWLAYPGTTGSAAIGWRLTDSWLDPLGDARVDAQYTERSLRLPDAFWCYDALAPGVEVAALPAAAAAGQITFGCLNNTGKLTDATLALWSGVFAALPDARLILMAPAGSARERLAKRLAAHGIDPARVGFIGFQHRGDYLRTYSQIDIALDTVPYNGHTTSLDAFWMGVPVPTRVGRAAAGRAGLSLLANLGLQELAADSDVGYVRIVVGLARDLPRLAHLRATLRARMQASPLMDGARFAHHMEAAFRHMWNDWCAQPHGGIAAPQPAETMATVEPMEPIEPINAPLDLVRHAAALRASDDVPAAEAALLRALALDAACAPAWLALGNLLREQDRRAESEAVLRKALDHVPNDADVPNNLGTLLAEDGRHAEAQPLIERALALRPAFADAWRNLGSLFMETHRESEAIAAFQRAVELAPHVAHTHNVLAGLLMKAGETTDAIESMRAVLAHDPADESAHGDLAYATLFVTDDGAAIRAEAERFFQQHEAALYDATAQHANVRDPARRLRIGYVSPDFRNHCQSLFTLPLFANHDHAAFEIVCYASVAQPDPVTHRIASSVMSICGATSTHSTTHRSRSRCAKTASTSSSI
ncbi:MULTISPECIES: tetratricopeptide repeat protein [unclassified Paraburkholderia]|uniref:O-linked N-acetylglucosamine transferase family protein n=1 Tax=unclassified Paraburkholderia TaxID=2615204 RepID=UPI002AAF71E3|nr:MULTISPECIES: tetratricopeptide repeat protein [unclassified Paraburkholderia]